MGNETKVQGGGFNGVAFVLGRIATAVLVAAVAWGLGYDERTAVLAGAGVALAAPLVFGAMGLLVAGGIAAAAWFATRR
jgi:hypothetical protein